MPIVQIDLLPGRTPEKRKNRSNKGNNHEGRTQKPAIPQEVSTKSEDW